MKTIKRYKGTGYLCDGKDKAPLKLGDKVKKVNSEEGDCHIDGSIGIILGSISEPIKIDDLPPQYCYAVIWEDKPDIVISTISNKLKKLLTS